MAILKMKFINIVGPQQQFDLFVRRHIIDNNIQLENAVNVLSNVKKLYPYVEENPYAEIMKKADYIYREMALPAYCEQCYDGYLSMRGASYYINQAEKAFQEMLEKKEQIQAKIDENKQILKHLYPMKEVDVQLEKLFHLEFIKFRFGRMPKDSFKKLQMYLEDMEVFVIPVTREGDYAWFFYFMPVYHEAKIDSIFCSLYFERIRISGKVHGKPVEALTYLEQENEKLHRKIAELEEQKRQYIEMQKERFINVYGTLKIRYEAFDIRKYAAHTEESFYICGWMPQEDLKQLVAALEEHHKDICYVIEDVNMVKTSSPPTQLKNIKIFRPFESLVRIYGLPSYHEIDPTFFISITYMLLFGMMFGDVGQGAVLALIGWYLYNKRGMDIGGIMLPTGIVVMVFGVLYGSIFGYETIIPALWMHPLLPRNIPIIMGVSIVLGVALISLAIVFSIVNAIREGDIVKVLLDKNGVAGLVFYWSILFLAYRAFTVGSVALPIIVLIICIIIPLISIAMKEAVENKVHYKKKMLPDNKGSFIAEAFFEVFDTVLGFVSNSISFIRVSAFALNHAGLILAVMTLAQMTRGFANIFIVVIGNIIVIGLEGLIVGIQDLRLGYYELFSRFFSGEGKSFEPISQMAKTQRTS